MMLGIAASISIAVPSGRRSHTGESSVKKIAMPKLTGIAIASAMADVTRVPTIGTRAPNSSWTGSQLLFQRKEARIFRRESELPASSESRIAPSRLKTKSAKNRVRFRKSASINALLRSIVGGGSLRSAATDGACAIAKPLLSNTALMGLVRSIHGLSGSVGDRLPCGTDLRDDRVGHRHVVELGGHALAVLEGPLEELEHFSRRIGLLLLRVDQDERGASDGPGLVAGLVGEHDPHARGRLPVGASGRGLEGVVVRGDELARLVLHLAVRELALLRVRVLDVTDGAVDLLHVGRHAFVALAADARGPLHRRALSHRALEFGAHLGEIVRPDEGRTGPIGAVDDRNGVAG